MKISKGNTLNINKRLLVGTLALTFLATKVVAYKIVKTEKYSYIKIENIQTDNSVVIIQKEYAILPKKDELNNNLICKTIKPKDNYKKNISNNLIGKRKCKILKK